MTALDQLARLYRYRMLQKQKAVSELDARRMAAEARIVQIAEEARRELDLAATNEVPGLDVGAYLGRMRAAGDKADGERRAHKDKAEEARVVLRAAFRELKKTELLRARLEEEARRAEERAEQVFLDEVAGTRDQRS